METGNTELCLMCKLICNFLWNSVCERKICDTVQIYYLTLSERINYDDVFLITNLLLLMNFTLAFITRILEAFCILKSFRLIKVMFTTVQFVDI